MISFSTGKLRWKNLFWTNKKFVFFFNCSNWEKIRGKKFVWTIGHQQIDSWSESSLDLTNFCVLTILGITTGSSSLVKHVSAGTLTSVTNFASSVSRNLDRLSLDSEHCHRNELVRRTLPQGVGSGLVNGMSGIGISILGAIGGMHPFIHTLWTDNDVPGKEPLERPPRGL